MSIDLIVLKKIFRFIQSKPYSDHSVCTTYLTLNNTQSTQNFFDSLKHISQNADAHKNISNLNDFYFQIDYHPGQDGVQKELLTIATLRHAIKECNYQLRILILPPQTFNINQTLLLLMYVKINHSKMNYYT